MIGKLDELMHFQQTALRLRAERQQVLASNIANADTPNYKARDIDFNSALREALSRDGGARTSTAQAKATLAKTAPAHLDAKASTVTLSTTTASGAPLLYRNNLQGNIDGNTVDMDVERNQFVDNALRYEAGVTFANGQLRTMLTAVQGQ